MSALGKGHGGGKKGKRARVWPEKASHASKKRRVQHIWSDLEIPDSMIMEFAQGGFIGLEEMDDEAEVLYDTGALNVANSADEKVIEGNKKKNTKQEKEEKQFKSNAEEIEEEELSEGWVERSENDEPSGQEESNNEGKKVSADVSDEEDMQEDEGVEEHDASEEVEEEDNDEVPAIPAWAPFALHSTLLRNLDKLGFHAPTAIQARTLPVAMHHRKDVVGAAETGSGKTLAFGLPILHVLLQREQNKAASGSEEEQRLEALVMSPTRELALQIVEHLKAAVGASNAIRIVPLVGGMAMPKQRRLLQKRPHIVVATPGRLWELMQEGNAYLTDFSALRFLVIDEADRMIERGHFPELESIIRMLPRLDVATAPDDNATPTPNNRPPRRQTFVFSATLTISPDARRKIGAGKKKAAALAKAKQKYKKKGKNHADDEPLERLLEMVDFHRKVEIVDVTESKMTASTLRECKIVCSEHEKDSYLYYFLWKYHGRTIVFVNSIASIRRLVPILALLRVPAWPMHAQMQQRQRLKNLDRFKNSERSVLVTSDVLARGVDIPAVDHVIHYQISRTAEVYVHRSGRTARASNKGLSVMLVSPKDAPAFKKIARVLAANRSDELEKVVEDFPVEHSYLAPIDERVQAAIKLDQLLSKQKREKAQSSWFLKQAEEADLDVSLDDLMDVDDDPDETRKRQADIEAAKTKLTALLAKPLLPQGVSRKYISHSQTRMNEFKPLGAEYHDALDDLDEQ